VSRVAQLALALEAARTSRSRLGKEAALAEGFRAIAAESSEIALATAVRFAAGRTLPVEDDRALGVGWSLLHECAVAATGWSTEIVRASARAAGELGEAFALLVARVPAAEERAGVDLAAVAALWDALAATGQRAAKRRLLDEVFAQATPLEVKYLVRAIQGELRVGAQGGVVETAIGRAFDVPTEELRRAAALVTDPGELAVLAHARRLAQARLSIGRPVAYMLATPLETVATPLDPRQLVLEDKIDGVRAQVHKSGPHVRVFARGLEDVSGVFPEIVEAMRFVSGSVALDGELVAFEPGGTRVRPFQALQTRLQRVSPAKELLASVPVTFVAYDYLADDAGVHLDRPWSERRKLLERFALERGPSTGFVLNPYEPLLEGGAATDEAIEPEELTALLDRAFDLARGRGQEGLVLKRIDAAYDAGRRGQAWIKVKKAFATLDVVVTAAEEGHGKRAGTLSDYTFAVWSAPASDAGAAGLAVERELVNVGKAFSGLSDEDIVTMGRVFERSTLEKFGGVRLVRPEVVIEVAFDGVQRSKRHKSGFALRFPRIVRFRPDKPSADADTLATVEALFRSQLESGHREEAAEVAPEPNTGAPVAKPGGPRTRGAKPTTPKGKPSAASRQLGLFDLPDPPKRR
jgi:DNA ligase-1